jgi:hypothetical protein
MSESVEQRKDINKTPKSFSVFLTANEASLAIYMLPIQTGNYTF